MEAGQSNSRNIGFIIQARMASTRLPGKVMLPLPLNGERPMIGWIVHQLKSVSLKHSSKVVVATSDQNRDDELARYLEREKIEVYRGDENDVLSRFVDVTRQYEFDTVIRLTGDNPLLPVEVIADVIDHHHTSKDEYTGTAGLPLGMNLEVIDANTLLSLPQQSLSDSDREHVTNYIRQHSGFRKGVYTVKKADIDEQLRFTVDYPADYAMVSAILSKYKAPDRAGLALIKWISEHYPWLLSVNSDFVQKRQFKSEEEELRAAAELLEQSEMNHAAELLRRYEK